MNQTETIDVGQMRLALQKMANKVGLEDSNGLTRLLVVRFAVRFKADKTMTEGWSICAGQHFTDDFETLDDAMATVRSQTELLADGIRDAEAHVAALKAKQAEYLRDRKP